MLVRPYTGFYICSPDKSRLVHGGGSRVAYIEPCIWFWIARCRRPYLTPSLPMFAKDQSFGKTFVQAVTRPPRRQYPRILFQHLNPPRRATYIIHPSMITEDWKPPPPYKGQKGERVRYAQFTFMY